MTPTRSARMTPIFVGDVEPALMGDEAWSRLESFVARRGGTLVLSAGPRAWPSAILGVAAVRQLLPVIDPRPASFDARPGRPGAPEPCRRRGDRCRWPRPSSRGRCWHSRPQSSRAEAVWSGLPRLPWVLAARAKPGATTLAAIEGSEPGSDGAVIAAQPYGLGKVLWVGTDATWRWRFRVGDAYHHRFWGQVVRWAAAGKLAAGNDWVRFGPDRSRVPEGESPRLTARFADGLTGVDTNLLVVARVFKAADSPGEPSKTEGDAIAIVPLKPVPGQPRSFAATAPALAPGRYLVRLEAPQLDRRRSGGAAGFVAEAALEITCGRPPSLSNWRPHANRSIAWPPRPADASSRLPTPISCPASCAGGRLSRRGSTSQRSGIGRGCSGCSSAS